MQSQDNCNLIDKSWILSTFHDSWTIILWEKELPAIFELSDSIHRSCHTDGQINIWWANEPKRNKKPPVFGKRQRSRGTNVENYSKWPTPKWISVYWHYMYIYISYVTVCFNDTIKSLHIETIACHWTLMLQLHPCYWPTLSCSSVMLSSFLLRQFWAAILFLPRRLNQSTFRHI